MGNEYFYIANGLRSKWAIDHKWLSTYILPMGACNGQQVLVMGNNTYILPMGEAKEPLAAPVHCLHRSVWAATKSQFVEHLFVKTSNWLLSQHLTFGAGDVLAVFKLDLSSGLREIAKTSSGCPPEHVVGDRPLRRLGEEDRQVAQVAGLVQDHPFSVLHLRGVQFDIQGGDIWFFT